MAKKMVNCKTCGEEIAKSAKVCPKCGAKQKKHPILVAILVIFGIIILLSAIGGKSDDDPKRVDNAPPRTSQSDQKPAASDEEQKPDEEPESDTSTFGIGEQVSLKDVIVTLNSVTESNGKQFFEPDEGNVYILCEFTIENNSEKELAVSSLLCFDGYVDDYATSLSITAQTASDKNQLDGTIAAGKKMNGIIGYEAPEDWGEIEIHFTPDFWSGKDIIFKAEK